MTKPVMITCAVTGGMPGTPKKNPAVPVTPKQIADECLAAADAGAAIVHIHVRNPDDGEPSTKLELFAEVVERVRASPSPPLINLTTGIGSFVDPSDHSPIEMRPFAGMAIMDPAEKVAHVLKLRPELCSLDIGSMNFGEMCVAINVARHVRMMAKMIGEAGVVPEIEIFELGHLPFAAQMLSDGAIKSPGILQYCLGVSGGAPALPEVLQLMHKLAPPTLAWSAFGVGPSQFSMVSESVKLGGHVRVGLEDNLYIEKGRLADGNAQMVEKAVRIVSELGMRPALPSEARQMLKL